MSALHKNLLLRAAILGVMSGMRSVSGPATITRRAAREPKGFDGTIFEWLTKRPVAVLATLGQVGEMVLDKLPILPNRIDPLPLLGRALLGGSASATAFVEARRPVVLGIALGAGAAAASAHLFYRLRVGASEGLGLPDLVGAVVEDGLVLALEQVAMRTYD